MGNFRYKHFTFYTCGDDECHPGSSDISETLDTQIKKFLNAVWPLSAIAMGDSAEGDYAFVTYVRQAADLEMEIENIYTYVRISSSAGSTPSWKQAITPVKSLNPLDIESE